MRHGQCSGNAEDRIVGQQDCPLTSLGYCQARTAAALLEGRDVAALYSSDLLAARETARLIAEVVGRPVRTDPALREQSFGSLEGTRLVDATFDTGSHRHLNEVRWGGGESVADVYARLARWFADLPPHTGDVVVVSHGHAIQIAAALLRGRGHRDVDWFDLPTGGLVTVARPVGADR